MRASRSQEADCAVGAQQLQIMLGHLATFLSALTPHQYTSAPQNGPGGAIGEHVRHALDHVAALLAGLDRGCINYDDRKRGTAIETDHCAALEAIGCQREQLKQISQELSQRAVDVSSLMSPDAEPVTLASTVGRELSFVLSHTIHHNAIVAFIAHQYGSTLPDHLLYAPATLQCRQG